MRHQKRRNPSHQPALMIGPCFFLFQHSPEIEASSLMVGMILQILKFILLIVVTRSDSVLHANPKIQKLVVNGPSLPSALAIVYPKYRNSGLNVKTHLNTNLRFTCSVFFCHSYLNDI